VPEGARTDISSDVKSLREQNQKLREKLSSRLKTLKPEQREEFLSKHGALSGGETDVAADPVDEAAKAKAQAEEERQKAEAKARAAAEAAKAEGAKAAERKKEAEAKAAQEAEAKAAKDKADAEAKAAKDKADAEAKAAAARAEEERRAAAARAEEERRAAAARAEQAAAEAKRQADEEAARAQAAAAQQAAEAKARAEAEAARAQAQAQQAAQAAAPPPAASVSSSQLPPSLGGPPIGQAANVLPPSLGGPPVSSSIGGGAPQTGGPPPPAGGQPPPAPPPVSRGPAPPPAARPAPPPVDERPALRKAAAEEAGKINPQELLSGKQDYQVVTVPSQPVAGAKCVVFFNRNRSDSLRHRPQIVLQGGCNDWVLPLEAKMNPEGGASKSDGSDWWRCEVEVPERAMDMSFVFCDGENVYDNNNGKDFKYNLAGAATKAEWEAHLDEIKAEQERKARMAQEEREREEAEAREAALREADQRKATDMANDLKGKLHDLRKNAQEYGLAPDQRAYIWWGKVENGEAVVYYNAAETHLRDAGEVNLNVGYNGWMGKQVVQMTRCEADADHAAVPKPPKTDADKDANRGKNWFKASYKVPAEAVVVNFVFNSGNNWDNNGNKDFHLLLPMPAGFQDVDKFCESLIPKFVKDLADERDAKAAEERKKKAARDAKRKVARDKALAVMRRQTRHVLYTEPEVIQANTEVILRYNPQDTPLSGAQSLYVIGGFNRWKHSATFGPVEMLPPAAGETHFSVTLPVPKDAFKVDFVFTDSAGEGGRYDNNNGFDYHINVEGATKKEDPLHVVHIAVEMAPIAKVGGLGDVVTAISRAVQEEGHTVEVIVPAYQFFNGSPLLQERQFERQFQWGGTEIVVTSQLVEGLKTYFIEPRNDMFNTQQVYAAWGDDVKFDFFSKAALEFLLQSGKQPDVLHCHDWSSAEVARAYWEDYHNFGLHNPNVVFTIHNLEFGQSRIGMAAMHSQKFTTVSPTYAFEIGGHPAVNQHLDKFMGIRNGIDTEIWDPETDKFLSGFNFSADNCTEGKREARKKLRERLNMTDWEDKPIVGVITRLTAQKGMHLIKHSAHQTLERGGQFVLLGSAPDPKVQGDFNNWGAQVDSDHCRCVFQYDEPLSHLIYAACDFLVVPSMFEPCGLTQLIAMRYGAVPIVRHTGGLRDTVFDVDTDKARGAWELEGSSNYERDNLDVTNGFAFEGTDGGALDYALNRAMDAFWNDRDWIRALQERVMRQDWSWNRPALDYIELYYSLSKDKN